VIPRKLSPLDKNGLIQHFKNDIIDDDRRLRFGMPASDGIVEAYINDSLKEYGYKNIWFVVEDKLRIVASCHVAMDRETGTAELGCTVSPDYRNQKIGQELFYRGVTWAAMAGANHVFMHCLSENRAIQHIAKKGGMTVITLDPTEKESVIEVKQNRFEAGFQDMIMDQIAIYDCAIRGQNFFTNKFLRGFIK
jgi:RimJ/RimL family protein N-acetyltransferase